METPLCEGGLVPVTVGTRGVEANDGFLLLLLVLVRELPA